MKATLVEHRRVLSRVNDELRELILRYFKLPRLRANLADVLSSVGLYQADLVLCLLRINTRCALRLAERLVGRRITVCPPCLRGRAKILKTRRFITNERRVTWVGRNKFLEGTGRHQRFSMLRPGMLESEFVARGGLRRDLRAALQIGIVRVRRVA